tara:strand:+ start:737 stop:910 length:174 start_codon:yes stop_codon:yes gene_type:complete
MFINFYDYVIQILEWCQLNCLKFKNDSIISKDNKNLSKNDILDDWVDYGFGKNDVIR